MSNFDDGQLFHSNRAINVTHQFYDKKFMLYVEGDDDVVFWDEHFRKYMPVEFYEIEQVHGKENLGRYIEGIKTGKLSNIVVACDSDFTFFMDVNPLDNQFIVKTYGHSIENTMFCPYSIATYIRRLSKTSEDYLSEVLEWLEVFASSAKKLLPYEVENEISPTHCMILPKIFNMGFAYFQSNQEKGYLDKNKIETYIQNIVSDYDSDRISELEDKINKDLREIRFLIQGHFIADAMMCYIRARVKQIRGKTISLSNDAIYESIVDCKCTCASLCADKLSLKNQIEELYHYFSNC